MQADFKKLIPSPKGRGLWGFLVIEPKLMLQRSIDWAADWDSFVFPALVKGSSLFRDTLVPKPSQHPPSPLPQPPDSLSNPPVS